MPEKESPKDVSESKAKSQKHKASLMKALELKARRVMKRCFMTGKQCKFSSHVTRQRVGARGACTGPASEEQAEQSPSANSSFLEHNPNVFVVMPFSPNLETFYRWSLRPYLVEGHALPDESVQRADEVRDIGYIICEKICRRVQEADLVIADISLKNANVFYEIGLAFGLERPIVFMHNSTDHEHVLDDPRIAQSLDLQGESRQILKYPGVGELDLSKSQYHLAQYVGSPPRPPRQRRELKICMLETKTVEQKENADELMRRRRKHHGQSDIGLHFPQVLSGAVGVAMVEIRTKACGAHDKEAWQQVVSDTDETEWEKFASLASRGIDGKETFEKVAEQIESSFATIIDVSDGDVVAYFWLGYCHARGLNAIPVYRDEASQAPQDGTDREKNDLLSHFMSLLHRGGSERFSLASTYQRQEKKLAFDIHALWYAEYDEEKPYEFKTKIREILEHLLGRDLPDRQKRAFWDRFPAELPMKLFTGAVHIHNLNREMIGDWDLRTVSRLYSFLPSVREAMAIELVSPMYSPEQAYGAPQPAKGDDAQGKEGTDSSRNSDPEAFLRGYRAYIREQLRETNAIVIASPDVNPVTEYLLHHIYGVNRPKEPFGECDRSGQDPDFTGYVAVKQLAPPAENEDGKDSSIGRHQFRRLFYKEVRKGELLGGTDGSGKTSDKGLRRGFAFHTKTKLFPNEDIQLSAEYQSQGDKRDERFTLLGHLVVAQTPQNPNDGAEAGRVVLLNGVSGPATFALAQILTGGGPEGNRQVNATSEDMLKELNDALDKYDDGPIEAIIEVEVKTGIDATSPAYLDSREPVNWEFLKGEKYYGPTSPKNS